MDACNICAKSVVDHLFEAVEFLELLDLNLLTIEPRSDFEIATERFNIGIEVAEQHIALSLEFGHVSLSHLEDLGDFVWIAIIALAVLIVMAIVVIGMIRSEPFTQWLAAKTESVANWGLGKLKRDPVDGLSDRVVGFRDLAIGIVKESGVHALFFSATGKLWAFVMLTLSLRIVGLTPEILSLGQIFIVWVIVLMITAIPITPGGIGIAAMAYIFFFSQAIGSEYADVIAAGVVLFRLAQWFLPIPIGWVSVGLWRRQISKGQLPDPFVLPSGQGRDVP